MVEDTIFPLLPLRQVTLVMVPVTEIAAGWVIVAEPEAEQLLASVTVTVYVAAERLLAVAVVCCGDELHLY